MSVPRHSATPVRGSTGEGKQSRRVRVGRGPVQGEAHPRRERADDAARRCHDEQRWCDGRSSTGRACAEGEMARPEWVDEGEGRPWLRGIEGLPTGYEGLGGARVG